MFFFFMSGYEALNSLALTARHCRIRGAKTIWYKASGSLGADEIKMANEPDDNRVSLRRSETVVRPKNEPTPKWSEQAVSRFSSRTVHGATIRLQYSCPYGAK